MIVLKRLGITSLLLGAMAVPTAFAAAYARTSHIPASGVILQWMENMGWIKPPTVGITTLTEASLFSINDQNGIFLLFSTAIVLAVAALCCAVMAEYHREPTLYLSSGYVCGTLAIALIKPSAGFVLFIAGVIVAIILRHGRSPSASLKRETAQKRSS